MSSKVSNKFRLLLAEKVINFTSDSFKIVLMNSGFIFNPSSHAVYADISANEIATGFGYTVNTKVLTGVSVTQDNTNNVCSITFNNATWTASGGDIGPACGAIIFDDTVSSPVVDPIVGFVDFGGAFTEPDGGVATIANIALTI